MTDKQAKEIIELLKEIKNKPTYIPYYPPREITPAPAPYTPYVPNCPPYNPWDNGGTVCYYAGASQ